MYEFYGKHFLAELSEVPSTLINDVPTLIKISEKAIINSGATIIESKCYHFTPNGYTYISILKESHVSIHAYPEHNALFLDVFTCGKSIKTQNILNDIISYLTPQRYNIHFISRQAP